MGLKEMSRRFRDMMQGAPDPAAPDPRPFNWDAPMEGSEEHRDPAASLSVETVPLRPPAARPQASPRSRPEEPRPRAEEPRSPHWRAKADVTDFRAVYAEAGITTPGHGYGVEKMAAMLANPHLASRPRDVRATAALAALDAAQVPLRDVIDDAVLRHRALAAFEAAKALELEAVRNRSRSRIDALQEQVRLFLASRNSEIDALNRALQAARHQLAQLQSRKLREEDRLLRVVTHFVEPRPQAPAPPPAPRRPIVAPALPADPALKASATAEAPRLPAPVAPGVAGPPKPGSS